MRCDLGYLDFLEVSFARLVEGTEAGGEHLLQMVTGPPQARYIPQGALDLATAIAALPGDL